MTDTRPCKGCGKPTDAMVTDPMDEYLTGGAAGRVPMCHPCWVARVSRVIAHTDRIGGDRP